MPSYRFAFCLIGSLTLTLLACGGDDANEGGSTGSSDVTTEGGDGSGATSSSAGKPSGGSNSGGSGGSSPAGSCDFDDAIVSCEVESGEGVRVCTEVYIAGTPADSIRSSCGGTLREGEHCPSGPNLVGICKGGVSTYYYAPPSNDIWVTVGQSCPVLMGTSCEG